MFCSSEDPSAQGGEWQVEWLDEFTGAGGCTCADVNAEEDTQKDKRVKQEQRTIIDAVSLLHKKCSAAPVK